MDPDTVKLWDEVATQVNDKPESFDMGCWADSNTCGTVGCIAGWALMYSGYTQYQIADMTGMQIEYIAAELLEVDSDDTDMLFHNMRWTPEHVKQMAKNVSNGEHHLTGVEY